MAGASGPVIDRKKLAAIHITSRNLGLREQEYREILEKVAGVRSARDLDDRGFRKLMQYFVRSRHYRAEPDGITFRQKMFIEHLRSQLGWDDDHLRNFLRKYYHKSAFDSVSRKEAVKLIESLKNVLLHHDDS